MPTAYTITATYEDLDVIRQALAVAETTCDVFGHTDNADMMADASCVLTSLMRQATRQVTNA